MGNWQIIIPYPTTNLIDNPQMNDGTWSASNWTLNGDGVPAISRDVTYQFVGTWSLQMEFGIGTTWQEIYQSFTCTATSYTLSARVRRNGGGTVSASQCRARFDNSLSDWDSITDEGNGWHLCVKTATSASGAGRQFGIYALEDDLRIDAAQLENLAFRTTYCDGTRPGCRWLGQEHASESFRDADERSGGRIYDFDDDLSMPVENFIGTGMPSVTVRQRPFALTRGAVYQGTRANSSNSTITFWVNGSTVANLHSLRQDMIDAMKPDAGTGDELFMIRYTGAAVHKERGHAYEGGLELANWRGFTESIPIRVVAPDPAWLGLGEAAAALDDQDSMTSRLIIGRDTDTWIDFGPPNAAGTYTDVRAIEPARGYCSKIYVGGNFLNWDNIAAGDYIAQWDVEAETWSAMGTGCAGGQVYAIERAGDNLFVGGAFTSAGGVANTARIAYWDISTSTWTTLGDANNTVYGLHYASDGYVYAVGNFTTIGGVAATRAAYWDGTTWNAMGAGLSGIGYDVIEGADGNIYVCGVFALAGGVAGTPRIAYWDGSAWNPLDVGLGGGAAYEMCLDDAGNLYVVGAFVNAGTVVETSYMARWNGAAWESIGDMVSGAGLWCCAWINGQLYVGGQLITTIDGWVPTSNRAKWNGSAWSNIDFDIVASPHVVYEITPDEYENVYYGHDSSGTAYYSGQTTVTNGGTMAQRPLIWFQSAVDTQFLMLRNLRTGAEINFDLPAILTTGEVMRIDLREPESPTVTSDIRGNLLKDVIPGSVLTNFELLPGDNVIDAYGYNGTAGTTSTSIYIQWQPAYWSTD